MDFLVVSLLTCLQKKWSLLPSTKDQNRFFSRLATAAQPCQVRLVSTHEQRFHMQFWGNKMRNHILYPTPPLTIEMSNKERAAIDIVFFSPSICMLDPKNLKNIKFYPRGHGIIQIDVVQPVRASDHSKCHFRLN